MDGENIHRTSPAFSKAVDIYLDSIFRRAVSMSHGTDSFWSGGPCRPATSTRFAVAKGAASLLFGAEGRTFGCGLFALDNVRIDGGIRVKLLCAFSTHNLPPTKTPGLSTGGSAFSADELTGP